MQTITKKTLVQAISRNKGLDPKQVQIVVQKLLDYVTENLAEGNRFEFRNFGVFEIVRREQKIGRNPKNPTQPIIIPARDAVKFTSGNKLTGLVRGD